MNQTIQLLLLTVTFFWGTSFAAAKVALTELHPLSLVILRFTLASLIFGMILMCRDGARKLDPQDLPTFVILGFLGITSYFYIQFTGLQYTTTIHSALIIATSPIIVGLLGALLHLEKINGVMAAGIILAFVGVTLIITGGNLAGLWQSVALKGDLLLLCNAMVWAGFTLYGKKLMQKYSPLVAMAYIHIFGTLMLLPVVLFPSLLGAPDLLSQLRGLSWPTVWAVLYLAIFCSVYGYCIWYAGVEKIGAVRTSVFTYLNPLFAALTGVWLLGEHLPLQTLLGGCLVMVGVYVTNEFKGERAKSLSS